MDDLHYLDIDLDCREVNVIWMADLGAGTIETLKEGFEENDVEIKRNADGT